jgi:transposase
MRSDGLARQLKVANWVVDIRHPTQSPDLNPIEGIWNIIKQHVCRRVFYTDEEVKQAPQEEWDKITLEEIGSRISNTPERCRRLIKNGGRAVKTAKW